MADADLPVFSFRANWREPVAERVAFLTDILAATEGAEQRRQLRTTPRRSFEADFLLTGAERTFWDLFINALGGGEVVAPLYWEVVTVPAALTATGSDRIEFDTSFREWQYHTGYLALLIRDSALDYEVVEIAGVDANGVDLAAPVTRNWPKNTRLYPLRRAVLDQVGEPSQPSAAVATVSAEIRVVGPNPWDAATDDSPTYAGLPVFLSEPNWVQDLTVSQDRVIDVLDRGVGLTYQVDATGRVLLGQAHRWFLPGREKLAGFRDLIYRHRGRAGRFWLPTFKADLRLVSSVSAGASQITVENVGYLYTGGPTSGREHIAIKHGGGTIFRRVLSVSPGLTPKTERLNLDSPVGLDLAPGQVRRISFMDTARFDADEFEIVHFGGVDAHHESSATFRTFKNTRTSPTPIHYPQPAGVPNNEPCGFEGNFPGWFLKIRHVIYRTGGLKMTGFDNVTPYTVLSGGGIIEIKPKFGVWDDGNNNSLSPDSRPTALYRAHDGVPWYFGDPIPEYADVTHREYTYWDVPVDAVPNGVRLTIEEPRRDLTVWHQVQYQAGSVEADTRGYIEYRFWDQEEYRKVPQADYATTDEGNTLPGGVVYDVDSNGEFPVFGLFPAVRGFTLRRLDSPIF